MRAAAWQAFARIMRARIPGWHTGRAARFGSGD
jgi:hypothetical protein